MSRPMISVLMPAYNCAKYLPQSIESILGQTFTDFEFIIINDGSTDDTESVILSYGDPRIVYLKNEKNAGLVFTLNRALQEVEGKYVARMDGDDISLPDRFEKQFMFMERNRDIDVLATFVDLIDENGHKTGHWAEDIQHADANSIRKFLVKNNCIAHPTVMVKSEVLLKYRYYVQQALSEDYDLWLRISADGGVIDKLAKTYVLHRILQSSFTRTRKQNIFLKLMMVKLLFVWNRIVSGRVNRFTVLTFLSSIPDGLMGIYKSVKSALFRK